MIDICQSWSFFYGLIPCNLLVSYTLWTSASRTPRAISYKFQGREQCLQYGAALLLSFTTPKMTIIVCCCLPSVCPRRLVDSSHFQADAGGLDIILGLAHTCRRAYCVDMDQRVRSVRVIYIYILRVYSYIVFFLMFLALIRSSPDN